jgi:hypothetical protein
MRFFATAAKGTEGPLRDELRALRRMDDHAVESLAGAGAAAACAADPPECPIERNAAAMLVLWQSELTRSLPAGTSPRVEAVDPPAPQYVITIEWPSAPGAAATLVRLAVET